MRTITDLLVREYRKDAYSCGFHYIFTNNKELLKNDKNYLGVRDSSGWGRHYREDRVKIVYLNENILNKAPKIIKDYFKIYPAHMISRTHIKNLLDIAKKYPKLFENITIEDVKFFYENSYILFNQRVYKNFMHLAAEQDLSLQSRLDLAEQVEDLKELKQLYRDHKKYKRVIYEGKTLTFRKVRENLELFYIACEERMIEKKEVEDFEIPAPQENLKKVITEQGFITFESWKQFLKAIKGKGWCIGQKRYKEQIKSGGFTPFYHPELKQMLGISKDYSIVGNQGVNNSDPKINNEEIEKILRTCHD